MTEARMRRLPFRVAMCAFLLFALPAFPAPAPDETFLREHQVTPDAAGLLGFLRELHPTAANRERLQSHLQKLGSDSFDERDMASAALVRVGILAGEELKKAAMSKDVEVRRRVEEIRERVDSESEPLFQAALRLTRQLRPAGAARELLPLLTSLPRETQRLSVLETLVTASRAEDAAVLVPALRDPKPDVRAAAIRALGSALGKDVAEHARPLFRDADETVRLAAVLALAAHEPRECLGPLVELLDADSLTVRSRSDAILRAITGEFFSFAAYDAPEQRKEAVGRWREWVKQKGQTAKLAPLTSRELPSASRMLLCLFEPFAVREVDLTGKTLFSVGEPLNSACGCQALANGNRVFADWGAQALVELNPAGKLVSKVALGGTPNCLHSSADGSHLVGLFDKREVVLVKDGKIAWRRAVGGSPTDVARLENGRILVALHDVNRVVEIDEAGKVVWKLETLAGPESGRRLRSGNTLVTSSRTGEAIEYTPDGKIAWRARDLPRAFDALELENGHILVGYQQGLRELDRTGKTVRDIKTSGPVRRICRY
jgi:hypothetical protein